MFLKEVMILLNIVESFSGNGGFSFVFYRDTDNKDVTINGTTNVTTNVTKKRTPKRATTDEIVYGLLKSDPTLTRDSLALSLNKSVRTIQRALDKLSQEGKIRRMGSNKKGYWEVF